MSEEAASSLSLLSDLCKQLEAELTTLYVVDPRKFYYHAMELTVRPMADIEADYVKREQEKFQEFLASVGVPVQGILRTGEIAHTIASYAADEQYNVIALLTAHRNRVYDALRSSLTAKLMDISDAAVLTVDIAMRGRRRLSGSVLCALSQPEDLLGETNRNIIAAGKHLATKLASELTFVHVREHGNEKPQTGDWESWLKQQTGPSYEDSSAQLKFRVEDGAVAQSLARAAEQEDASILVTGRSHRHPLFGAAQSRLLDIVHAAPCAVMCVTRTAGV